MESSASRRTFIVSFTAASTARVLGANDRIRLALVGAGSRGSLLAKEANRAGGIEWAAVCDAWDKRREEAKSITGGNIDLYADYRKLLERKDIDAVIVATWDNNHSMIATAACRAGKDVYVEKPMTSRPEQGPPLVRAVRETGRKVQVGVQQRSTAHFKEAKEKFIDSGVLGKVHMVRTMWNNNIWYLVKPPAVMETKPAGLDWDACLGSVPKIPWDPKRFFNAYSYMDLGCGQSGGLFVHLVDVVQWYLGITRPSSVVAGGGIYQYPDGRDTPDNLNLILQYPERVSVTFEASLTEVVPRETQDIVLIGTGGRLHIFRYGYRFIPAGSKEPGDEVKATGVRDQHMKNWLECVRSREEPNATVEQGHYSAMACHMGNMAYLAKREITWQREWDI